MLKKMMFAMAVMVGAMGASRAELKVDIIAGAAAPIPVAIQKFETVGGASSKDAAMIREVVENDLKSTGLFRIVNHDAFPEFVKMGDMPNFQSWAAIKVRWQSRMVSTSWNSMFGMLMARNR